MLEKCDEQKLHNIAIEYFPVHFFKNRISVIYIAKIREYRRDLRNKDIIDFRLIPPRISQFNSRE